MMAVSFGQGLYALFSEPDLPTLNERQVKDRLVNEMTLFEGLDTVIVDTAGRLQIDEDLMAELERVRDESKPHNVLLVLDATTGAID